MTELLDQPAVVVLAAAVAAVCLLVEVALPTVGLAGSTGIGLGLLAAWGVRHQGADWWPLVAVAAGVALWGVLVAVRRRAAPWPQVAALLYLGGAGGYALLAEDGPALATAAVTTVLLVLAFPRIAAAADRLASAPPAVGMDSLPGRIVQVVEWEGGAGRVVVDGSRWSARGPEGLHPGDEAVVVATDGLSLRLDAVVSPHG